MVKRITSEMAQMKRQILNNITKAKSQASEIIKARAKGFNENNLLLSGLIRRGAGHIEHAQSVKLRLEAASFGFIAKGWAKKNLTNLNFNQYLSHISTYSKVFGCFSTALFVLILKMS